MRLPRAALALALLAPWGRGQEAEEVPTDPAVIEQKVKEIEAEYDALKSNQDMVQTRRRRELTRRLGTLKSEKGTKLLNLIVENDGDLRTRVVAMHSISDVGDIAAIRRMYRAVLKEQNTVLPDYLGPALAHAKDPETGPWIVDKVLSNPNKILRLSAVEAIAGLRTPSAREPLLELHAREQKKARREMHLVYEVLRALGQVGGDGAKDVLYEAAKDSDWRARLAAAEVLLVHHRDERSIEVQRELLKDEKPIVRETAAIAAGRYRIEPLMGELVLLLREGNLRSKKEAVTAMAAISGQDFGYAPDAWDKWWRDKKSGRLAEAGTGVHETISVGTYYNFKIFSDRVLFVVDVSGSMQWPEYHPNRIEVAHREITKAIRSLRPETLFNVMSFAGHVETWQKDGEVPATPDNIEGALEWCGKRLLPRGPTNTHLALTRSLEDNPLVDTVYFLSDGMPSAGQYELPEEILIKLRYENRFRKVIFNTIALAIGKPMIEKASKYEDPDEMTAFMQMIADWNGGTCVDIRKPWSEEDLKRRG